MAMLTSQCHFPMECVLAHNNNDERNISMLESRIRGSARTHMCQLFCINSW
jgi:hypothetical protein